MSFENMSLYVSLPSDSSLSYFPENKFSQFISRLPDPIELEGEWVVSLAELIYPHIWSNLLENGNEYGYNLRYDVMKRVKISFVFYESFSEILKWIHCQYFNDNTVFTNNKQTRKKWNLIFKKCQDLQSVWILHLMKWGKKPNSVQRF